MGRISNGWAMSKMSLRMVLKNRKLLLFPVISGLALVAILASFLLGMFVTGSMFHPNVDVLFVASCLVFYFVAFFITIFFNVALVACAMKELNGEATTISYGIGQAASHLKPIVGWALLAATVGLLLKAVEERAGVLGKIVIGLIGAGWAIATYFVVPVIAFENLGPIASIKRSLTLLKGTWGEMAISNIGIGLIFFLLALVGIVPVILAFLIGGWTAAMIAAAVVVVYWIFLAVLASAASGVLLAALYRYATTGKIVEGFPEQVLRNPSSL